MQYYIGVDPGKSGGCCVIAQNEGTTMVTAFAWDDREFIDAMKMISGSPATAFVEKVAAMPKQGIVSTFTFGKSAGFIEGVLSAYGIAYQLVPPRVWKKEFSLNNDKDASIEACRRLFPHQSLYRTERCTKPHDGIAEACLIAEYARRVVARA